MKLLAIKAETVLCVTGLGEAGGVEERFKGVGWRAELARSGAGQGVTVVIEICP